MITKSTVLLSAFLLFAIAASSQASREFSDIVTDLGMISVRDKPTGYEGSIRLFDNFLPASVFFQAFQDLQGDIDYDLYFDQIVVSFKGREMAVNADQIDSIKLKTGQFLLNRRLLQIESKESLCERLAETPKLTVVKCHRVDVLKPDYNVQLDIGSPNYRFIKNSSYYVYYKDTKELVSLKPTKSGLKHLRNYKALKAKMKAESIPLETEMDVVKAIVLSGELL
ncbi:MAG: hypothetical protein KI790_00805 [Cyclobacteriaceae bacterium]|nr:hypothetical protein [Cyclobacteriaceae bacterium HetDA_MAG_MS6]